MLQKETLLTSEYIADITKCDACKRGTYKVWWIESNKYCAYCINIEITNRNSVKKMIEKIKRCGVCLRLSDVLFEVDKQMLCRGCSSMKMMIKEHGFIIMNMAELEDGGLLDIDRGKREHYKTVIELQRCGWFVKEKKVFTKGSTEFDELSYKTTYRLLYIGKKKCKRFPLMCWPVSYTNCMDALCSGHVTLC
jgi:hypothetical protein